jgi:glucose-1-phosphate thymidylyltransferase
VSADCEVGPGAVVGPDTALGWNVTVGPNATVEGSVLDADVRVGPGATLVDTVAGEAVRVGSGAVVLAGPGDVRVGDRVHRDERLGAVFADRATLGGAASAGPGTLVGPRAVVDDGVHVDGVVDGGASVSR